MHDGAGVGALVVHAEMQERFFGRRVAVEEPARRVVARES